MSRIGKKAVTVPTGVTANVEGQTIKVKGPKGALQVVLHDEDRAAYSKALLEAVRGKRAFQATARVR